MADHKRSTSERCRRWMKTSKARRIAARAGTATAEAAFMAGECWGSDSPAETRAGTGGLSTEKSALFNDPDNPKAPESVRVDPLTGTSPPAKQPASGEQTHAEAIIPKEAGSSLRESIKRSRAKVRAQAEKAAEATRKALIAEENAQKMAALQRARKEKQASSNFPVDQKRVPEGPQDDSGSTPSDGG